MYNKFKYIIEKIPWMDINISLYDKGNDGWELIQILPDDEEPTLIYKKTINDETTKFR